MTAKLGLSHGGNDFSACKNFNLSHLLYFGSQIVSAKLFEAENKLGLSLCVVLTKRPLQLKAWRQEPILTSIFILLKIST